MRGITKKIFRKIVAICLLLVVVGTSIPISGLNVDAKKDSSWDGTFESEVLGKTPDGWKLLSCDIEGKLEETDRKFDKNYSLVVIEGKKKGTKALSIQPKVSSDGTKGYVLAESQLLDVTGSTAYSLNYAMMIEGAEDSSVFFGGKFYAIQYDKKGKELRKTQIGNTVNANMDWENYTVYMETEPETVNIKLSMYVGGTWTRNKGLKVCLDEISFEKLSSNQLLNGGFEKGVGNNDIYSWHLRSTPKLNDAPTTANWVQYYELERIKGYHGDGVSITRKGYGYVSLDSNLIKVVKNSTYVLDYAYSIANAEKSFVGLALYVSEYDENQEMIGRKAMHAYKTENTDWKELSYTYKPSDGAAYIRLEFACGDWGAKTTTFTVCLDDVRVTAIRRNMSTDGVNNGDFEEVYDGTVMDWTMSEKENISITSTFDGYNSSKGLYVKKIGDNHDYINIASNQFDVVEGKNYKATYMVRLDNQIGNVYIVMLASFYDKDGERIESQRADEFDHRTSSAEWQQEVGYYTVPKGAKTAQVRFQVCGTAYDCYLDDVEWRLLEENVDSWGFDTLDKQDNISGWTINTSPAHVKLDKKTYREGTGSLFLSQTTNTTVTKIHSDTLIPLEEETLYKFTVWVKSYSCNVAAAPIRLCATSYDKDGEVIGKTTGIYAYLNESSEPSEWKELICGIKTKGNVAYVRPYIQIEPGSMNLWIDDLDWTVYKQDDEFFDDFDSIRNDGTPDGWSAEMTSGNPTFVSEDSVVTIEAKDKQDIGTVKTRWDTAVEYTSMTYTTTYATTGNAKAKVTIKFYDYKDQEVKNARVEEVLDATSGAYETVSFDFLLTSAKYMMIEFSNEGTGTVSCDGIYIAVKKESDGDTKDFTTWRGKWVWYTETAEEALGYDRFFRVHVYLPDEPARSALQITADNRSRLWVNGEEVVYDPELDSVWDEVNTVTELPLKKGDNILAFWAKNHNGNAGLLFDGFAETVNGEWVDIYASPESTISATEEYEGWKELEFDDSGWTHCKVMATAVGGTIWGDLPFDSSYFVKEKFEVVEYSATEEVEAGEEVLFTMTVIPEIDITSDIELKANIWKRNTQSKVLSTVLEQVSGPPTNEWKAGEKVTVSYKFKMQDYIGSGKYVVQLDTNQVCITNVEYMNNKFIQATKVVNDIKGNTIKGELKEHNGTPAIFINGEPQPVMMYTAPINYSYYTGSKSANYMHDAGICVTRIWSSFTQVMSSAWVGEDEYDWDVVDEYIYDALSDHPDTYLMITLDLDVKDWWLKLYPDEAIVNSEGDVGKVSFFSEKMVEDTIKANKAMIQHMQEQSYWNRIIGAVLCAGRDHEWNWYSTGQFSIDYGKAGQDAWKKWVKEEYKTDEALQKAWNDKSVTLDTVKVPTFEEGNSGKYSTLLEPTSQKAILDYQRCMEETEANILLRFANEVTEMVDDNWILGAYYGYLYTRTFYYDSPRKIHAKADEVLDDPNVDFFCAPSNYAERYDGESGSFEQMAAGVLAHGKAVIKEDDLRLCSFRSLSENFYEREGVSPSYTVSDSISQVLHSFLSQITTGVGNWYFNLGGNYFEREQFSDVIEIEYNEQMINLAREKDYSNDVAYILDEDLYYQFAYDYWPNYEMSYELIYEQRYELTRIGASVDYYSMTDLEEGLVPDHKVYIMIGNIEMDDSEREAVDKYLKNKGKIVLWQYICGASNGETFNAKNMSEVIDINVTIDTEPSDLGAVVSNKKHWLTEGIQGTFYGNDGARDVVSPTAIISDSKAEVLAYMSEDSSKAALAVKDMGEWTSIFSTVPGYTTEMLRNVLKKSGVHIYSDDLNDVIYANLNYVGINCAYGGEKSIKLDGTYAVYDVFGQTTYSLSTDTIEFTMDDNSTKLFRLTPVDTHVVYVDVNSNGTSKQAGYHEVKPGKNYDCEIKAKKGYIISEIIIDGESKEVQAKKYSITFKDLANSHYVKAKFEEVSADVETVVADKKLPFNIVWIAGASITAMALIVVLISAGRNRSKKRGVQNENKKE